MMEPVREPGELAEAIEQVRRRATCFNTNWFAAPAQTGTWIGQQALSYVRTADSVLILRRDRNFYRVYHAAAGLEQLAGALAGLDSIPAGTVLLADLVGLPAEADALVAAYLTCGFNQYRSLIRLIRTGQDGAAQATDSGVEFARLSDVPAVSAFLDTLLDPFVDQIPTPDEVREAAERQSILMVRGKGLPAAILWFETTGLTSLLRYWYVAANSRNQGLGARLIRTYFEFCRAARRIVLWVIEDNQNAIDIYRRYGFRREGLVDRIAIRNGSTA